MDPDSDYNSSLESSITLSNLTEDSSRNMKANKNTFLDEKQTDFDGKQSKKNLYIKMTNLKNQKDYINKNTFINKTKDIVSKQNSKDYISKNKNFSNSINELYEKSYAKKPIKFKDKFEESVASRYPAHFHRCGSSKSYSILSLKLLKSFSDKLPPSLCPAFKNHKEIKTFSSLPRSYKPPTKQAPINCSRPQSHGDIHRLQRYFNSLYSSLPCKRCRFKICKCKVVCMSDKTVQADVKAKSVSTQSAADTKNKTTQDYKTPSKNVSCQSGEGAYLADVACQVRSRTRNRLVGPSEEMEMGGLMAFGSQTDERCTENYVKEVNFKKQPKYDCRRMQKTYFGNGRLTGGNHERNNKETFNYPQNFCQLSTKYAENFHSNSEKIKNNNRNVTKGNVESYKLKTNIINSVKSSKYMELNEQRVASKNTNSKDKNIENNEGTRANILKVNDPDKNKIIVDAQDNNTILRLEDSLDALSFVGK